ncbi:hypothetical protein [Pseudomonas sp. GD03944]|uniref:AbiTii domain-containing protein n=1 Tax=Pseudomonas sp. GD03944 TaxID=2975409 RepID=UPI002448201A|nr:hypothetical protein [Pseudomonas sp. GD03944]MDH1263553.1 hypothetical protein [Pseudomonas sp. GD03944]
MKLINEAIELVSNAEAPLASAFIKAQIIAHKLQDRDFAQWVRSEIQGYADRDSVPEYRAVRFTPHGTLENLARRYENMPLPLGGIPQHMREKLLTTRFQQSIAVIEGFALKGEELTASIKQEMYPFLLHGIDESYSIVNAWGVLPAGTFAQILTEARSRLLDLLLNLADQIPTDAKDDDLSGVPKISGLNEIFKGAVFGHGANINFAIGDGSQASNNSTSVAQNDIESLLRALSENKVASEDLQYLRTAIEQDANLAIEQPAEFGAKVKDWMAAMIRKAGTAAWDVPVQAAASILATNLSKYYGL